MNNIMKKILLLIIIFYGVTLLSWCKPHQSVENKIYLTGNQKINTVLSWENEKKDISFNWSISSGIKILWPYSNIINSWNILYYNNIFNISLFQDSGNRLYYVTYSPIASGYTEALLINNLKDNSISIKSHSINDIISFQWKNLTMQEICTPYYEEWIRYQPETTEKIIWSKKIYLTYATFDVSGPDMEPFKNFQAEICFVQEDRVYNIFIGDIKSYRKDIVDSFNFIE
jgi:hypothetical protein